ncbi:hypothetical protein [Williamwhitmania taraxaci]|uniref:Uncharacterized protein n=1 Tax=Williamwhitmania taraxaci TaxID=1640674 RepID=A0A1G6NM22_9BACT|nr:hypothetical protein [Williamwhitmania taraxaci]SDC68337.1 hypothetical protein SAMN05216323_10445 [Williamwhitmania taraxaci]
MMKFPKLNIDTIFDVYDKDELLLKLRELKFFCFLRGRLNCYVTDGDEIVTHISFLDKLDLIQKLELLGVKIIWLSTSDQISYGKPWPENLNYPTPSHLFPDIAEPSKQIIFDEEVLIYISDNYFSIYISNSDRENWWKVNYNQIATAKKLEVKRIELELHKHVTLDGQKEYGRYINRYHYPGIFE